MDIMLGEKMPEGSLPVDSADDVEALVAKSISKQA